MVQLFISQPMRGRSDEEIAAEREYAKLAAERILKEEVEVIDSFFQDGDGKPYMETGDTAAAAAELESMSQRVNPEGMTEGFRRLYEAARGVILPEVADTYLQEGNRLFNARNYADAAVAFEQAVAYDASNVESIYQLAQSYRIIGENEKAVQAYDKVLELFPDTWQADKAQSYKAQLSGN